MHYLNQRKRDVLLEQQPDIYEKTTSKVLTFVNSAIYPYKFELIYDRLRTQERITPATYNATKGVVAAFMVMSKRMHREYELSIDCYILDFILLIRSDLVGDPVKFLLNMRRYFPRFMFVVGIREAFGIDWREFVFNVLDLKKKPQAKSYHAAVNHIILRKLLHAYCIWKFYRESHDPDYQEGVNDVKTLVDKYSSLKTNQDREGTEKLFDALQNSLPSWSAAARARAAWAIDTAQDGTSMVHKQFSDWRYKQVQG